MDDIKNKKIFNITKENKIYVNGDKATYYNKKTITFNEILKEILKNDKTSKKQDCVIKLIQKDKNPPYILNYKNNKDDFNLNIEQLEIKKKIEVSSIFITFSTLPDISTELTENRSMESITEIKNLESDVKECLDKKLTKELIIASPNHWDILENIIIKLKENFKIEDNTHIVLQLNDNFKRIKDKNTLKLREPLIENLKTLKDEIREFFTAREIKLCQEILDHIRVEYDETKALEELSISIHIHTKIKSLAELELNQFYILNDNSLILSSALKVNNSIKKLSLASNKIGSEGSWGLNRMLYYNKNIVDLDLSYNFLTDDCVKLLCKNEVESNKFSLVKLNLSNNPNITFVSGEYVSKLILLCPYLLNLNLSKTTISNGLQAISHTFINNIETIKLQTLIIFGTKLDSNSILLFSEYISNKSCKLKSLVLSDNNLKNEGGDALLNIIPYNESLEELYLFNCNLDSRHSQQICKIIRENKYLQKIYLYKNNIIEDNAFKNIIYEVIYSYNSENDIGYKKIKSKLLNNHFGNEAYYAFLNKFFTFCEEADFANNLTKECLSVKETYKESKKLKIFDISKNANDKIEIDFKFIYYLMHINIEKMDLGGNFLILTPTMVNNANNTIGVNGGQNGNSQNIPVNNITPTTTIKPDEMFTSLLFLDIIENLKSENYSKVFTN